MSSFMIIAKNVHEEMFTGCHVRQSCCKCNSGVGEFRTSDFGTFHPNEGKNSPPEAKDHRDDSQGPGYMEEN